MLTSIHFPYHRKTKSKFPYFLLIFTYFDQIEFISAFGPYIFHGKYMEIHGENKEIRNPEGAGVSLKIKDSWYLLACLADMYSAPHVRGFHTGKETYILRV